MAIALKRVLYGYARYSSDGWQLGDTKMLVGGSLYWAVVLNVFENDELQIELLAPQNKENEIPIWKGEFLLPGQELSKATGSLDPLFPAKLGDQKDQQVRLVNLYSIYKKHPNPKVQIGEEVVLLAPQMLLNIAFEIAPSNKKRNTKSDVEKLYTKAEEIIDK